jgi:hypothetical protein
MSSPGDRSTATIAGFVPNHRHASILGEHHPRMIPCRFGRPSLTLSPSSSCRTYRSCHHPPKDAVVAGTRPRACLRPLSLVLRRLGEPLPHSHCPTPSPRSPCARAADPTARASSVGPHRPPHRVGRGHGDRVAAHMSRAADRASLAI